MTADPIPASLPDGGSAQPAIVVIEMTAKADLDQFIALPHRLYADDPAWIAPLAFEQRERFKAGSHYSQHARWKGWLARRDGAVVGRVTAQIDSLEPQAGLGYFGMLEAEDIDVVEQLLERAEGWLRDQGMTRVRGPLNLHINEEVGLLVDGFDTPPSVMMGHAQPWYEDALLFMQYEMAKELLAYRIQPDFPAPAVMQRLAQRAASRVTIRSLNRKELAAEAETMRTIFNDAWSNNWGFVPMDAATWAETVSTLSKILPDDYIQFAEVNGKPEAFMVALPNVNEAARDLGGRLLPFGWLKLLWRLKVRHPRSARVPLMGVTQAYQHTRLGPTLAFMVTDAIRKALHARGVTEVEISWILEDNDGMRSIIHATGGELYKRYRVYEKDL